MDLRQALIDALFPFMDGDYDGDRWAANALDAMLDTLEANAPDGAVPFNSFDLIAVLRGSA